MVFSHLLLKALQEDVVGQDYAVTAVTRAVTLALCGFCPGNRPLGVLLFAGPTCAGKSHLASGLTRTLLGNERKAIHVNCQQLRRTSDPLINLHEQILAGAWLSASVPPYTQPPLGIVIFEEIDKAPADFRESLGIAIDRGGIFARDRFFTLHNSIIILTVSLSKKQTDQLLGRSIGFFRDGEAEAQVPRQNILALEEMDNMLGTHLVSRIDEIILFERLTEQNIITWVDKRLEEIRRSLAVAGIGFSLDPEAKAFLISQAVEDLTHGMRQAKRVLKNMLEFPLADLMLSGRVLSGMSVSVTYHRPCLFLNFQILIPSLMPADPEGGARTNFGVDPSRIQAEAGSHRIQ